MTSDDYYLNQNGQWLLCADGPLVREGKLTDRLGKFGLLMSDVRARMRHDGRIHIAQLYDLVLPGLILTKHVFQGLNRPLFCDDDQRGDKSKLVYCRRPAYDVVVYGREDVQRVSAPSGKTFLVIISPNIRHRERFADVDGWIEHWNWVEEDAGLDGAPVKWVDRYDTKLASISLGAYGDD